MKIVITGSLGNIGKPLTTELVRKGHNVTVVSRSQDRKKDIEAIGASAAIGSLDDSKFITEVFLDKDAVYAMVPPNYNETDQIGYYKRLAQNYAQAIPKSTIRRIVHLSSYGAHLDKGTGYILGAHHAEGILNELPDDVAVTHLRPTYFYYNFNNFAGMIKEAGIIGANYGGEDKLVMVAPADIAEVAAEELEKMSSGKNVRYVNSDERTANEVAKILGTAIGKPDLQWLTFTNEQVRESMEERGMPPHVIANIIELGASIHSGALREDYELHPPDVMGKVKIEDFAKEFARSFQANA